MPEIMYPSVKVRWLVFAVVLIADVMDLLSTTVTNLAAPSIVRDLHAPDSLAPWLGSAYALTLGSTLVLGARLGDRYGTRRLFLIGLAGYTIASLLCAASMSPAMIIAARGVQGLFGALLIPQGFSLLLSVFPRPDLGRVFGLFGPLLATSSISGPVLAGFLLWLDPFGLGWRAVFGINVVIGVVLQPLSARVLPRGAADRSVRLDPAGAVLLTAGLVGILGGLIQFGDGGGNWWPAGAVAAGLLYATSLYLQFGRGLAPLPTAAAMAPASAGIIAASFSTRALIERLGRRLVAAGLSVMGAGTISYLAVIRLAPTAVWAVALPLLVCGLGMGCCFGSVFAVALGDVQPDQAGSAAAPSTLCSRSRTPLALR